jgi:hypothetical protein
MSMPAELKQVLASPEWLRVANTGYLILVLQVHLT